MLDAKNCPIIARKIRLGSFAWSRNHHLAEGIAAKYTAGTIYRFERFVEPHEISSAA